MTQPTNPAQFRDNWVGPNWLRRFWGSRLMFALLLPLDLLMQVAIEGIAAAWPGFGTSTALPLIGQSRGLVQGEAESDTAFGTRAVGWLDVSKNKGADETLAQQIQSYLGNTPTVRIVNRKGFWVTANPDGTTSTTTDTAWNWDSVSNPERNGAGGAPKWWSDIWIIVAPSEWAVYASYADPDWANAWGGAGAGLGLGHKVARTAYDAILSLVAEHKGAHTFVQAIIFTSNVNMFKPGSLALAGNPDGTWGYWGKIVSGVRVPARTTTIPSGSGGGAVRYWIPSKGGA